MGEMSDDLKNLKGNLRKMVDAQKREALNAGKKVADKLGADTEIVDNRYLDVTFSKQDEPGGVIDLKEGFSHGSKVRYKRNGGWYTIVPISYKASSLSNAAYQDARELRDESTSKATATSYIDYLYGGKSINDETLAEFGITTKPHGGNLSRVTQGATRGSYFAFRTVSDKSSQDSWLLLKDTVKAQQEDNIKLRKIGVAIQDAINNFGRNMTV